MKGDKKEVCKAMLRHGKGGEGSEKGQRCQKAHMWSLSDQVGQRGVGQHV